MPPRSAQAMAEIRALPRLRLHPMTLTRMVRCANDTVATRLLEALLATGRYTAQRSRLYTNADIVFSNAPDDVLLVFAGGTWAISTGTLRAKGIR